VLWLKGMFMLNQACDQFPALKKQAILELTKQAFFDIGSAEAKEISLHSKIDLIPEEYMAMIELKVSIAKAAAEIGAVIGDGTAGQVKVLGQYAKTLGVLMTIRDEFIDMFEPEELANRFKNECLPLPILYAFKDAALKKKILEFLTKKELLEAELDALLELVYESPEVCKLGKHMREEVDEMAEKLRDTKGNGEILIKLLSFSLQDLPS
jgi:geranylgeranyl pyrophosphate synthase